MRLMFILFLILFSVLFADEKKEIDTNYVSNLNKIAMDLISNDNIAAKKMLDSAFNYAYEHNAHYWVAKTYQNMGLYHIKNDSIIRATEYLEISARAFENVKLFDEEAYSNIILADLYYSINRYEKGIEVLKNSEKNIDKLNDQYVNSIYLKFSELYEKIGETDSAEIFRTKVNLENKVLDFKVDLNKEEIEELNNNSQIVELKRELEVEKMKSEWIVWILLGVIILLVLIVLIISIKLYNAKKEIYNLHEKNN